MNRLFFFFLLFSIGSASSQTPYFIPNNASIPLAATGVNSMDVESADLDDDGDIDIVVAAEYGRNLLFFNDGNGFFSEDPNRLFPEKNVNDGFPGEDSEDIAFADFDQDGDLDVIFVSEDTSYHELLVNNGSGSFSFIVYEFPSSIGNAVTVMDLNSDNFPDIIIGNTGQNHIYINNHDLTFTQENNRWPTNTEGTQDLKQIDIDNDGDMDIVEGIDLGSNNILINTNGFFVEENNRLPNTGLTLETRKITIGDTNGDNYPDIFVATVNFIGNADLQNRLYLNDGNGFFTDVTSTHLPVYIQNTLDAVFIDYDFDNDLDLLTTDFQNPATSYHSFENNAGIFTETTNEVFQPFNYSNGITLHAADFNNDGYRDLYFGNFQETDDILFFSEKALDLNDFPWENNLSIFPNPVQNTFTIEGDFNIDCNNVNFGLYDIQGRLLNFTLNMQCINGHFRLVGDISNLKAGHYIYAINTYNSQIFKGKLIKR